jgi:hypothetical protein
MVGSHLKCFLPVLNKYLESQLGCYFCMEVRQISMNFSRGSPRPSGLVHMAILSRRTGGELGLFEKTLEELT